MRIHETLNEQALKRAHISLSWPRYIGCALTAYHTQAHHTQAHREAYRSFRLGRSPVLLLGGGATS
jgi:hypothetical protein